MIYIASPFFNEEQLNFVKAIEAKLKENYLSYYSPREGGILMELSDAKKQLTKGQIYQDNIDNIDKAELLIAVIDGRDTGTIWEMGYATAKNKRIVSISNYDYGLNVMLAESVQAHVKNLDDMVTAIADKTYKGELITNVF